ncbi:hypothetical protein ACFC5Z_34205, partial [Streptomyces sp. NPDC056004]
SEHSGDVLFAVGRYTPYLRSRAAHPCPSAGRRPETRIRQLTCPARAHLAAGRPGAGFHSGRSRTGRRTGGPPARHGRAETSPAQWYTTG